MFPAQQKNLAKMRSFSNSNPFPESKKKTEKIPYIKSNKVSLSDEINKHPEEKPLQQTNDYST